MFDVMKCACIVYMDNAKGANISIQSDHGLHLLLTESLTTAEYTAIT